MKIAVTGATGLIGSALVTALRGDGDDVVRLVRGPATASDERSWDPDHRTVAAGALEGVDAVVHLAGAGVADRRWTESRKALIRDSRVNGTIAISQAVAATGVPVLLSGSAIGWYGDTGDRVTDESGRLGNGFLAETCAQWEASTAPAEQAGVRVAHLRTGIVLDDGGGALPRQVNVARAGVLAPLGSGHQWVSWITLRDEVAAIRHLLTADVSGPVNLVAPSPVTNREFTKTLNRVLHRPTPPVPVPPFVLRAVLGGFADEGLLIGQRLAPGVLEGSGFRWSEPVLEPALRAVLGRPA